MKQTPQTDQFTGLSDAEAESRLRQYGKNVFRVKQVPRFLVIIWNMVREPMFLLLLTACLLYFLLGSVS